MSKRRKYGVRRRLSVLLIFCIMLNSLSISTFAGDSVQITKSTEQVVKRIENEDISYTVNYWLVPQDWQKDDPVTGPMTLISPNPKTVSNNRSGAAVYEEAVPVDDYLPDLVSKSLTIRVDEAKNVIDFYYKKFSPVAYTVRYVDSKGNELIVPKVVDEEFKSVVIEFARSIPGYVPMLQQQKLILNFSGKNELVFVYMSNTDAEYTVEYYYMDVATGQYKSTPDESKTLTDPIGLKVKAAERQGLAARLTGSTA